MKTLLVALATLAAVAVVTPAASADDNHHGWGQDYHGANHHWRHGERMGYDDWRNARQVDWRSHHLRAPPRGYEWRESNGQYILAAAATGLIAGIVLASH